MTESLARTNLIRKALFDVPIWVADIAEVAPHHRAMAGEVEELLDAGQAHHSQRVLARQTPTDPFVLPSAGWAILERETNRVYEQLVRASFQRWRAGEFHVRRRAIRLEGLSAEEKARPRRDQTRSHSPALFSSLYYLQIPTQLQDGGGTRFWSPIDNLMDVPAPTLADVPAREGTLIVFPSILDHAPLPSDRDAADTPRIVVSTDLFYVNKQATAPDETKTVIAAGRGGCADSAPRAAGFLRPGIVHPGM